MKAQFEEQMTKNPGNMKIDMRAAPGVIEGAYYSFYQADKAIKERLFMQANYVYDALLPKIGGQLANTIKEIRTYNCKKAVGFFDGRQYSAWYCPDIPVNAGPWRLSGLPGFILGAADTTEDVKFVFQVFFTNEFYGQEMISVPTNAGKTTEEKFEKMQKTMRENQEEFLKNNLPGDGTGKINKITPAARNLFNTPMILLEKKL